MLSTSAFLLEMIPLYMMALIGYVGRRVKILNSHANGVITQMLLYMTLPALILYSLNTNFTMSLMKDFVTLIIMSIYILAISVFTGASLRRKANLPLHQKSVYESLIVFGNQGFIGFAIIYILMGEQGIIYLTFFNICYLILIWTYGIYLFTKNENIVNWKQLLINPGILSTLLGVIVLLSPFTWATPLLNMFETVGKMTIPLSMILIGSLLSEVKWRYLREYIKNKYIWIASSFRLIVIPSTLFLFLFFNVSLPLLIITVITSAMPSATTTSIYAQKFGGDTAFASFGVLLTTLLCVITIPFLYSIFQWLSHFF